MLIVNYIGKLHNIFSFFISWIFTAAGILLDSKQACSHELERNDYGSLVGTFTLGLGVAHILLGAIYMAIDSID